MERGRALVLGGGGLTGIAWEIGIVAGLREAGIDLTEADLVVGTSAGSAVGAQLTSGVDVAELLAAVRTPSATERMVELDVERFIPMLAEAMGEPARLRVALGTIALSAATVSEAERLEIIAARLPAHTWPRRPFLVTAVDAHTGERRVFDRDCGVPLVDAVAASCAVPGVWPPVTIGGHRYIDGGVFALSHVDLVDGCERVVVLAPLVDFLGLPVPGVHDEVARLPAGTEAIVISPDEQALEAIGDNPLDPGRQPAAAEAGYRQARSVAADVRPMWTGAAR